MELEFTYLRFYYSKLNKTFNELNINLQINVPLWLLETYFMTSSSKTTEDFGGKIVSLVALPVFPQFFTLNGKHVI